MTLMPLAAGIGIEGVIWIIILIFWSIAQYVQKSRATQRRPPLRPGQPPPPPARPPTPMETELQDLLRELTGQPPLRRAEMPEDEEAEDLPEPEPPPVVRQAPPPPAVPKTLATARKAAPVPPQPTPLRRQPVLAEPAPRRALPDYIAAVGDLSEGMGAAFQNPGKMPGLTMSMRGLNMKAMALPSGSPSQRGGGPANFRLSSLRDPNTLRQMVIARAILDRPKSLQTTPDF